MSGVAACAGADREVVVAPLAPPVIDAGIDANTDAEASAEGGIRRTTRVLREPVNKPNCKRAVRCRAPDEEEQSNPFPEPFGRCAPALAKDKREVTFSPKETRGARANEPDVCCYVEFHTCTSGLIQIMEGRALRALGQVQRPTTGPRPRGARSRPRKRPRMPASRAEARSLAAKWTRAAENEHASIATFARLSLELLALGAPMDLVMACQRAGADEVRHAEDAYALASAFAGEELGAMPFPEACAPIVPDVVRLARETLEDGCIGESAAALAAMRDAEDSDDPATKAVLRRVARDESRHAELAFRLLGWTTEAAAQRCATRSNAILLRSRASLGTTTSRAHSRCMRSRCPWCRACSSRQRRSGTKLVAWPRHVVRRSRQREAHGAALRPARVAKRRH